MELRQNLSLLILIVLQISSVISKKRHKVRTIDDSIENILYYKDCNHKSKGEDVPLRGRSPPTQQECKMSCTMCCGDQCIDTHQMNIHKLQASSQRQQMQKPFSDNQIQPIKPPQRLPAPDLGLLPPIGARRDYGSTKNYIKNLISQDADIRKILKELVNVTMQKVAVMKMMNVKDNEIQKSSEDSNLSE